jgi:large conductance mechanosensitive channel
MTENFENIEKKGIEGVKKIGGGLKNQFSGFVDFIRTQGVVGFAVAFILGGAVSALVTSLVINLVNPILGVLLGSAKDLAANSINFFGGNIMYGKFLNDLINFLVIALVVYFGVKKLGLDKLDKPKN